MELTPARVERERDWLYERGPYIVSIINELRTDLGEHFETDVPAITEEAYRAAVDEVFSDGDLAVNVAAYIGLLRDLDVVDDYPGFVVDEVLGRELAATIAGSQPLRTLGESVFHYADITIDDDGSESAGVDDLDAALAAGFQERIPGWSWTETASPFSLEPSNRR